VSESQGDGQPNGQPTNGQPTSGQPTSGQQSSGQQSSGQPRSGQQGNGGQSSRSGRGQSGRASDPVADFQRWLMKAGARSMANQVAGQVKRTLGQERRYGGDVWDTATNEPPPNEPPECQWCPVCQAARAARVSGPGLGATLANAGGVLASVVQDAFSAFEQVMKTQDQNRSSERTVVTPPPSSAPDRGDADK
jgi:hypothetical protein